MFDSHDQEEASASRTEKQILDTQVCTKLSKVYVRKTAFGPSQSQKIGRKGL